jgi:dienelactone hydrolase
MELEWILYKGSINVFKSYSGLGYFRPKTMLTIRLRAPLHSLVLALCLFSPYLVLAQTLEVAPDHVFMDESAVIRVKGLQPKERVSIQAGLVDGAGQSWASQADFTADGEGTIDVSKQAPTGGSYKEISAMGLIWSLRPTAKNVTIYRPPANFGPQSIEFRLLRNAANVATARLQQIRIADGVQQIKLTGQLHGVFFTPSGTERHPAVLVVGGSEGGVPIPKAVWLASHGFAALALAYFRYENLPQYLEAIPLEYFGQALQWMMNRPEVQPDHIGVVGGSRGGELALQLGSMYPQIRTVIAYVPANVRYPACCGRTSVPYAWTWKGQPLSYMPVGVRRNPAMAIEAAIAVEQTKGPILLISGGDDGVWQSSAMADAVVDRLKRAHFAYSFDQLKYSHAGHGAGRPDIVPAWHGSERNPTSGREVDPGGTIPGNAQSSIDAAPKVVEFLRQGLKASQP